eukprot:7101285-Heterocapsa_arctica.AAC.1
MENKNKGGPPLDAWKSTPGSSWQRNQAQGVDWSWEAPSDQEAGGWNTAGQQSRQKEEPARRPEARVEEPE